MAGFFYPDTLFERRFLRFLRNLMALRGQRYIIEMIMREDSSTEGAALNAAQRG